MVADDSQSWLRSILVSWACVGTQADANDSVFQTTRVLGLRYLGLAIQTVENQFRNSSPSLLGSK